MSNVIKIYTDIDTLFDTRRGILEHLAKESGITNFTWSRYEPYYKNRVIDYFEKPELGITHSGYLERFKRRCTDDWVDDKTCYFYPSYIPKVMLPIIRSIEFGETSVIQTANIELTINSYPFELTDELKDALIQHILSSFKIRIDINVVYITFDDQTANYINHFNYVFRYSQLLSDEIKTWYDTYDNCLLSGVKFIVPYLLARSPNEGDTPLESLNKDSIRNRINALSALQGGKSLFISFSKDAFDYIDI